MFILKHYKRGVLLYLWWEFCEVHAWSWERIFLKGGNQFYRGMEETKEMFSVGSLVGWFVFVFVFVLVGLNTSAAASPSAGASAGAALSAMIADLLKNIKDTERTPKDSQC